LPAANADQGSGGNQQENASKTEEVVNYEISRTTKTEIAEGGLVKQLSVAVLVDGVYAKDAQGATSYTPRPKVQLDQISALVRTAIGFDKDRGDQVQVINLKFAEAEVSMLGDGEPEGWLDSMMSLSKSDYFTIAELAVIALVSLLVLLMVVRPLVARILTPEKAPPLGELTGDGSGAQQLTGPNGEELALPSPRNHTAEALEGARAMGEVQAKAVEEVGETIRNNPDEAVTIVRDWIAQEA